jgi:protein involved in polysaccharide export with SLBB domain
MRLLYRADLKFKYFFLLILCCFAMLLSRPAFAQTIPSNLSTANINELSDNQIKQIMQQAQANNLTDTQLLQSLQARGLPPEQSRILQARIDSIKKANGITNDKSLKTQSSEDKLLQSRKLNYNPDTTLIDTQRTQKIVTMFQPKIFGSEMFKNNNLKFEPNLKIATPVNYIVGPEDQLNISVYGNSVVDWKLDVSPEGNINIPGVGVLNVAGKTFEQATASIKSKLIANNYAIGRGTSLQVSLGNIRSIKVIIVGEVVKPGTYTLPSLATAFNALSSAGGPNDVGSYRKIEIIRNNRVIRTLDIYDFLVKGSQKDNISLQDQDVIRVPSYQIRVDLRGEVKTPALFEVLPGENLDDVIRFSGGFSDQAYTARIKVTQVSDQQRRLTDVFENDYKNYIPLRGDKYVVDRILDRYTNRVTILGAVFRPGEFELQNGLTISQLIKNAGGLKEDAFTGRGSIIRLNTDNSKQQLSFNVNDVLSKASADIRLQREDSVTISSKFDLRNEYKITIKGEVRKPGDFIYADSIKVADLIIRAGGFTEGASSKRIEVSRRVFDSDPRAVNTKVAQVYSVNVSADLKTEDTNFSLQPYDIVSVYSLPGYETQKTVKVEGEVIYPGWYTIQKKNEKISDIIVRAGGLTQSADVEGGSLKRDNAAVLGVDKTKIDTIALNKERTDRLKRLQLTYKDTTTTDTTQLRNNFVGIDLKKILKKPGTNEDLILENGDVLRVPKQQQTVRVNGEVLYPSAVVYSNGKSFNEFVLNAGGFSPNALKSGAYVVYPNGTVKGTRKFLLFNNHPSVKPGSEIYVPKKPVKKGNTTQEILAFTTGLASLGAIILGILNLSN